MKKCPVCGQAMEDAELFCANCGAKYEEPAQEPTQEPAAVSGGESFCPNCGERVEGGTVFCPNCGANTQAGQPQTPAAPAKKGINSRVIGIALAGVAAVAVIVLAVFLFRNVFASPADKFLSYQMQIPNQLMGAVTEAAKKAEKAEFSTDMTLTASSKDATLRRLLRDSAVVLKVDMKKNSLLMEGGLSFMGSDILSGMVSADKDKLGVYLPELDDHYYTISVEALMELMGVEMDASDLEAPELPVKDVMKIAKSYVDIITGVVTKENVEKSDKKTFKLDELGGKLDGESYVFRPTAEDVENMLEKLADQLEGDKALRKLLVDYVQQNEELLTESGLDVDLAVDDFEDMLEESLEEAVDLLRDNAAEIGEMVEDMDLTWTVGVSKGKLCLDRIEMTQNGSTMVVAYESNGEETVFYAEADGRKAAIVRMECKEKNGLLKGFVSFGSYGYDYYNDRYGETELFRLEFKDVNTKKSSILGVPHGTYTFKVQEESVSLEVAPGEEGGTDHTVALPEIYVSGIGYVDGLEVTLNTSDKKSTAAKPKAKEVSISDYDEDDLYELVTDMGSELEDVLYEIMGELG